MSSFAKSWTVILPALTCFAAGAAGDTECVPPPVRDIAGDGRFEETLPLREDNVLLLTLERIRPAD
jgi:hypothetical protein